MVDSMKIELWCLWFIFTIIKIVLLVGLAPLLAGWMRWLKCYLQNRTKPPIIQPYKNLLKLWHKDTLNVAGHSWIFTGMPYIYFSLMLILLAWMPSFTSSVFTQYNLVGNIIVFVGILSLARFFLALAGLDIGTAFGGMGSSREMMTSALAEPSLLLILFTLALKAENSNLFAIVNYVANTNLIYLYPAFIFTFLSAIMVTIVETGRIPAENPTTHLELTMTHEAMILEYSGKHLALIELSSYIKTILFFVLLSNLFFPWGIANTLHFSALLISFLTLMFKMAIIGLLIVSIETVCAKMRLFRIPLFLGMAFALCLLGIVSHVLF